LDVIHVFLLPLVLEAWGVTGGRNLGNFINEGDNEALKYGHSTLVSYTLHVAQATGGLGPLIEHLSCLPKGKTKQPSALIISCGWQVFALECFFCLFFV
jgi:hypothetical protein